MSEYIQTKFRTATCGQIRTTHVGQTVTLAGWVHNYRDYGGMVFVDVRDRDGLTQLVFTPEGVGADGMALARKLRSEWVITIGGTVSDRGADDKGKSLE